MISLACLDLAGTTVADDGAVLTAFTAALEAGGLERGTEAHESGMAYARETMGQSKIEVFRALFPADDTLPQTANAAFEAAYLAQIEAGGVTEIPGARDVIEQLRAEGTRVALTTGFAPATRDAVLDRLGWHGLADLVLSPADAGRGRPFPDMLLVALIRTRTTAVAEMAAVGDTTSDLLAGTRAGAGLVVGVRTGAHGDAEFATVAHTHVVDAVTDLPALFARG